ncbi:MAG: glycoside hydrolase family 16 protein [Chitinispirillales bacterium]|jgi:beta-glucanase (GH16 family)|nr:glycoside hydrolase family 16 protein [Chitinispirillales bacterium]
MNKKAFLLLVFSMILSAFAQTSIGFSEYFDYLNLINFDYGSGGNKAKWAWENGVSSEIEDTAKVIKLAMDPADKAGAWQGQNFSSQSFTHFGKYSARIKIPNVQKQPNVGGVVGFYTYYSDLYGGGEQEKDANKNGLNDNSEIDLEWLIANPQLIYMTAWTDYEESGDCRKISRIVNLASGKIYTTNYGEKLGSAGVELSGIENSPENITSIEDFDASKRFYVYGFDWRPESIRWWIINPESRDTITLWNYGGNIERITQKPARLMFNIWHTNDWAAEDKPFSVEAPADTFWAEFDWVKYERFDSAISPVSIISQKKQKTDNYSIKSVQKYSNRTVLTFNDVKNAKILVYSINGRKLYESEIVGNGCVIPNFRQRSVALVKKNGKTICRLSL